MFCPKCGNNLPDNATFCNNCGTPMNNNQPMPPQQPYYQPPKRSKPMSEFNLGFNSWLTALILKCIGLAAILFGFIYGIVKATGSSASGSLGSLSDYASYFGGSSVKLGGGGFGAFMLYFFAFLVAGAILFGIGDIIYRMGKKDE